MLNEMDNWLHNLLKDPLQLLIVLAVLGLVPLSVTAVIYDLVTPDFDLFQSIWNLASNAFLSLVEAITEALLNFRIEIPTSPTQRP